MKKVIVIGSSNTDMVVRSEHLPRPGETVLGGAFMMAGGGKGANQAVAVARMGHPVRFACALGKDIFGDEAVARYAEYGIDTSFIVRKDTPSGVALIMVDGKAQNSISVALGANNELSLEDVMPALDTIEEGDIVYIERKKTQWLGNVMQHKTVREESLYDISQSYGIRHKSLAKLNRMALGSTLKKGEIVKLK